MHTITSPSPDFTMDVSTPDQFIITDVSNDSSCKSNRPQLAEEKDYVGMSIDGNANESSTSEHLHTSVFEEPEDDEEEEYFEDFHLPNTHANAFVRHKSYRRRVQQTPIEAPDANRVADLVRRHRIIAEEGEGAGEEGEEEDVGEIFRRDIGEIERMLELDDYVNKNSANSSISPIHNLSVISPGLDRNNMSPDRHSTYVGEQQTSTPKGCWGECGGDDSGEEALLSLSLSMDASTLLKIQDCLDASRHKDLYNLTGRLQDMLSPKEVDEILANSEAFRELIKPEVIQALALSNRACSRSPDGASPVNSPIKSGTAPLQKIRVTAPKFDTDEDSQHCQEVSSSWSFEASGSSLFETNTDSMSASGLVHVPSLRVIHAPPSLNIQEGGDTSNDEISLAVNSSLPESPFSGVAQHLSPLHGVVQLTSSAERRLKVIPVAREVLFSSSDGDDVSLSSGGSDLTEDDRIDAVYDGESGGLNGIGDHKMSHGTPMNGQNGMVGYSTPLVATAMSPLPTPPLIPEWTASEESFEERHWRSVIIGGVWRRIDMKIIAPFRQCIRHGGYLSEGKQAVITFSSCYLPDRGRQDYDYVMNNLFLYVLSTLEQLITDDYLLVYLAGGTPKSVVPSFHWLRQAYQLVDRRLRKNLKSLLVVHPSLWVRTVVALSRPFISSKFYHKLTFVSNLTQLAETVPLDQLEIPDVVKHETDSNETIVNAALDYLGRLFKGNLDTRADFELMICEKKKQMTRKTPLKH